MSTDYNYLKKSAEYWAPFRSHTCLFVVSNIVISLCTQIGQLRQEEIVQVFVGFSCCCCCCCCFVNV